MKKRSAAKRPRSDWEKRTVRELIREGHLSSTQASDPRFVFLLAVGEGQSNEAKDLIDGGWVDVKDCCPSLFAADDRPPSEICTLLQHVASRGNLELTEYMVKRGADPNHVGPDGTALQCAGRRGHESVFAYLKPVTDPVHHALAARYLEDGDRRPRSESDAIARLFGVCLRGRWPTFTKLLAQGIDANASTIGSRGRTALHAACQGGHVKFVRALLDAGADPNAESYDGITPLGHASTADVCKVMLRAGADVNHRDHFGFTPVMRAIHYEEFCCLVKAGAEMTAVDNHGRGVLLNIATTARKQKAMGWPKALKTDTAFDKGMAAVFRRLIKARVPANDRHPGDGVTALMLVAALDLLESVAVLLRAGADPDVKDEDGKTALDYAKKRSPLRKLLQDNASSKRTQK